MTQFILISAKNNSIVFRDDFKEDFSYFFIALKGENKKNGVKSLLLKKS